MTWQRVAALGLLLGGAVAAAAFHNDILAATLAAAAAGFAVHREPVRNGDPAVPPPKSESSYLGASSVARGAPTGEWCTAPSTLTGATAE